MDPPEPKAISLCFFSKLVLRNNVQVVHNAHTSSPLPQRVVSAWSVPGGFATGNTSELAPSHRISLCRMGENTPAAACVPASAWVSLPCCKTLLLSANRMRFCSLGGNRGAVLCCACVMGLLQNFCRVICYWEQPV